jgi:hypothetical protein
MASSSAEAMADLASIGIDIGKDVFHIVGFDPDGRIVLRRKFKRLALVSEFERFHHSHHCRRGQCAGARGRERGFHCARR